MHRALALIVALTALVVPSGCGSTARHGGSPQPAKAPKASVKRLAAHPIGVLPAAVQLPAVTPRGADLLVAGGLTAANTSTAAVVAVRNGRARAAGTLPAPEHDLAAATIRGRAYAFGGGDGAGSRANIISLAAGTIRSVGNLPVAASDVSAAAVGGTAYIVGGYDGARPLRSIVAFDPRRGAHLVARLPAPLRYTATVSFDGRVLIAGGTDGTHVSRDIVGFDPVTRKTAHVATLPTPVAHASAAVLGGALFVIGGRTTVTGGQTSVIWKIDPTTGRTTPAGRLPEPLSDTAAVTTGRTITVLGGRDSAGRARNQILSLRRR